MAKIYTIFDIQEGDEMFSNSKIICLKNWISKSQIGGSVSEPDPNVLVFALANF